VVDGRFVWEKCSQALHEARLNDAAEKVDAFIRTMSNSSRSEYRAARGPAQEKLLSDAINAILNLSAPPPQCLHQDISL
jgi:hypothetical protein